MTPSNGSNGSNGKNANDGAVVALSRLRTALARPRGAARVDQLISAADAPAAVAALSVPELYALVKEVGFADTTELLALATPEQVRGCLDMDVWDRDVIVDEAARPWLATIMEAGFEKLGEIWDTLDPEFAALILARWTRIYDLSLEEEVPDDVERPLIRTPDTFFAVEITAEHDDDIRQTIQLIDDLYKADMVLARHTLMAARTEPMAELEEMSYRWRSGRMADLGYVDFYEALEVFRPLDPAHVELGEATAEDVGPVAEGDEARVPRAMTVPLAEAVSGVAFLRRALERIDDPAEHDRLETAVVYLVNRVLSAARVKPGDEQALRTGAEHAAATLSLGLETVAAGDVDHAVTALRNVSLTRLHRVGFTITLRLARLARALAPRAGNAEYADRALIAGLMAARPWLACELDEPPTAGVRPFASRADIQRAAAALTRLALRIAIAEQGLGVNLSAATLQEHQDLDHHARTALARALAGGEADATPLGLDELPRDFGPDARETARAKLVERLDRAGVSSGREYLDELIDSWLWQVEQALADLPENPDPRFINGILLRHD